MLLRALLYIGSGCCVSSSLPGDEVLEHIPAAPFRPDSRLRSHLAAFYQPSPAGSMRIRTVHEMGTFSFEGLVSLSLPEGNLTKSVKVNAFPITSSGNSEQTWFMLAVLDFSILKAPCNNPAYFLPAMAVTPDQQQLVFFGFGPLPQCHNVFIWKYGSKGREIQTSNGEKVAHALHAIAISETTETQASSEVKKKLLHVFSYGGMSCDCFANTQSHEFVACVRQCKRISRTLWKLTFSQSQQDQEDARWEEIVMSCSAPLRYAPPPLIRPSLNVQQSSSLYVVMLCGGLEILSTGRLENLTHSECKFLPNTQLWLGSMQIRKWNQSLWVSGLAAGDVPFIPRCAFSPATNRLGMVNFNSIAGGRKLMTFDYLTITAKGAESSYPNLLNKPIIGREYQTFLTLTATSDEFFVRFVKISARVFRLVIVGDSVSRQTVTISEVTRYSSFSGRFPGSSSCYCPVPVQLNTAATFVNKKYLVVGGSCRLVAMQISEHDLSPKLRNLWTVVLMDGHAIYSRRPFPSRSIPWGARDTFGYSVTPLDQSHAVLFGGFTHTRNLFYRLVYILHFKQNNDYMSTRSVVEIPTRAFHIAFRHNSSSLIIHGGIHQISNTFTGRKAILCDIWILSIDELHSKATDVELTSRVQGTSLPCTYGHTYTVYQGIALIYGGFCQESSEGRLDMTGDHICSHSQIYTIFVSPDAEVVTVGSIPIQPPIPQRAFHSLSKYTTNSLLLLGGVYAMLNDSQLPVLEHNPLLQNAPITTAMLIQINMSVASNYRRAKAVEFFPHTPMRGAHVVNGGFIFSGLVKSADGAVAKIDPEKHCPLGYRRSSSSPDCQPCPENYFSNSYGIHCEQCERYTTTNTTGSVKCHQQSPCTPGFCYGHGVCQEKPNVFQATCICNFGYLAYDNCQVPFVTLAIICGVLLFVGLLAYALIKNQQRKAKIRRQGKKLHVQQVELDLKTKKLDELFDAVNVQWKYLSPVKRLYPDPQLKLPSNSTINEVWEAELGDMPVAVKVLKSQHSPDSSLKKFVHEAEMLRVVNHPNIVNFLGAGTQRSTQRPFLIMELVKGGSLYQLLQNTDIHIDHKRRLSLAIDGAKGMEYLHGRDPSKIHRDLKSANLLVTSRGHLKVADFGTTRFIEILDKGYKGDCDLVDGPQKLSLGSRLLSGLRRRCQTGTKANDNAVPLLATPVNHPVDIATGNSDKSRLPPMTYGVGTDRWKAPETLKENYFDDKTDVYR